MFFKQNIMLFLYDIHTIDAHIRLRFISLLEWGFDNKFVQFQNLHIYKIDTSHASVSGESEEIQCRLLPIPYI
jgi:hypothetical protein